MRVKKRSKHRKAVKFYATCFGFREPYKVFIDGTFVHHLLTQRLFPAVEALRDLLSASRTPSLFTSKCIVAELRRLGKSHAETFDNAQLLTTTKCEHDKVVSAVNCVLSLIGDKNPEHFFVATQDPDLREKLREIPGVPVIYGLKNSLFIEQPSVQQRKFAQLDEEKRLNMDISEYRGLLKAASEGKPSPLHDKIRPNLLYCAEVHTPKQPIRCLIQCPFILIASRADLPICKVGRLAC